MNKILTDRPNMDNTLYNQNYEHDNCGAGFVCSLNGERSNVIIHKALQILERLEHRGSVSADGRTGDGAGVMIDIPHDFFVKACPEIKFPAPRDYAVGMVFLPKKINQITYIKDKFNKLLISRGLELLGWREVPVVSEQLGVIAQRTEPTIQQIFVKKNKEQSDLDFRKKLFVVRKELENEIWNSKLSEKDFFYLPSFSNKTLVYKGLIRPDYMSDYYVDLKDPDLTTRMALVHQRFSTNTFPSWDLAHPFRYLCHNGEINTLRGNISKMRSREELFQNKDFFDQEVAKMLPIIKEGKSDSASMDMVVELMLLTDRTLPEVMMMMVPEAWEKDKTMQQDKKDFYLYNSCIMEPWDGPASIPFTDGDYLGALLDRNGLRPSRYSVTKDRYVIMSSETGVLDLEPENILYHGRLEPGKMFLVDMNKGLIIEDHEIKKEIVGKQNWKNWIDNNLVELNDLPEATEKTPIPFLDLFTRKKLFGFTEEQVQYIVHPMLEKGKEPIGSMGMDAPIAVLSEKPQLLFNYFKQLFAQVTNPPLDGIREEIITDISMVLGADVNVFEKSEKHCNKLRILNPILSNDELNRIKSLNKNGLKSVVIPTLYEHGKGTEELQLRLDAIVATAIKEIDNGAAIIILSDRGATPDMAPIPSLLACSYVHHSLNKHKKRSQCDLIIESGEPREIHHYACLFGYGASAICPFLLYEILEEEIKSDQIQVKSFEEAIKNYQKAVKDGVVKVMNKIGISTLRSYQSAQIFEILGLSKDLCDKYFPYTSTRIKGIGILQLHKEILMRVENAFPKNINQVNNPLEIGGEYRWRRNGEEHMFNPITVAKLQEAVRQNKPIVYKEYSDLINNQSEKLMTIRGLLDFTKHDPISIDEVEPWTEIVKRFKTGAMSYGSISKEAHENLAIAMNRIGGKSNSGEGGEFADRFQKDINGDWRNSAIKQVASGRFGVTSNYLTNAKEIQIKMAQGAKPGEGGQLPGEKVYPPIAECRHSTPWVGLISPPPHHDIYSIEDLSQLIYDLKNANREARINVKLVSEVGVGTVAAGVAKAKADVILISGYDGGTGASPLTSLKHAGLPWELGLAEAQQTLVMNDLRSRVVLECDGQLKTGRDVAIACLLGAEEFGFATAPLVASGCIMMRVCHLNTCPVGVATQDPELRKKFSGKPEHVINFFYFVAQELREIMAILGFKSLDEMVGRVDKLEHSKAINHSKAFRLDLSSILKKVEVPNYVEIRNTMKQNHGLEEVLDMEILKSSRMSIVRKEPLELNYLIKNTDRSTGAILSNEISKIYGEAGLDEDTLKLNFKGSAGQSFGCFTTTGVTLNLEGDANDFIGKGLSGGKIIIKKPVEATFLSHENIIIGNVAFYGATKGEAYINGLAGERFCVRNSGVNAIVEGIGDHGCEYMTGGVVVVLGKTGRNFAAGMSGGVAYILDEKGNFVSEMCNLEMVDIDPLEEKDLNTINELITKHYSYTNSQKANIILEDWENYSKKIIKVMPKDYKKALELMKKEQLAVVS